MVLSYKNIVKLLLMVFVTDMFVFPAVLGFTLPYLTEATTLASVGIIIIDCRNDPTLFGKMFSSIKSMGVYALFVLLTGSVMAFLNGYDISLAYPVLEMVALMMIVSYIVLSDNDVQYIAFLGAFLGLSLGLYAIFNLDSLIGSLNDRLSLSGNLSANATGLVMVFAVFSTFLLKTTPFNRYIKLVVNILCVTVIVLTSSRQAILLCAIIYCLWLLRMNRTNKLHVKKVRLNVVVWCAVVVVVAIAIFNSGVLESFYDTKLFYRLIGKNSATSISDSARYSLYMKGVDAFYDSPFFGRGYNNIGVYTHSTYMEVLGGTGIFGFVLFYIPLILKTFKYLARVKRNGVLNDEISFNALSAMLVLFAMMIFRAVNYYILSQIMLAVALSADAIENAELDDE